MIKLPCKSNRSRKTITIQDKLFDHISSLFQSVICCKNYLIVKITDCFLLNMSIVALKLLTNLFLVKVNLENPYTLTPRRFGCNFMITGSWYVTWISWIFTAHDETVFAVKKMQQWPRPSIQCRTVLFKARFEKITWVGSNQSYQGHCEKKLTYRRTFLNRRTDGQQYNTIEVKYL